MARRAVARPTVKAQAGAAIDCHLTIYDTSRNTTLEFSWVKVETRTRFLGTLWGRAVIAPRTEQEGANGYIAIQSH